MQELNEKRFLLVTEAITKIANDHAKIIHTLQRMAEAFEQINTIQNSIIDRLDALEGRPSNVIELRPKNKGD